MSTPHTPTENELVLGGQGLVRTVALRLHYRFGERFELDDLIAFGQVGLAQAARTFDATQGHQFSTFAYYRIRGSIYEGIEKMGWGSRAMHRNRRMLTRANDIFEFHADQLLPPTLEEDGRSVADMTQQLVVVSFATLEGSGEQDPVDDPDSDPQDIIAAREIHLKIRELVSELPDEPRVLLEAMYFEGCSLQDAAKQLNISKSWASRLHARALSRLAHDLRGMGVEEETGSRPAAVGEA